MAARTQAAPARNRVASLPRGLENAQEPIGPQQAGLKLKELPALPKVKQVNQSVQDDEHTKCEPEHENPLE